MHANCRLQQRGIPPLVLGLLEQFGSVMRCKSSDRLYFDKHAVKLLRKHFGGDRGLKVIERWLGVYAIIGDDGNLVTAAFKQKRFRHL